MLRWRNAGKEEEADLEIDLQCRHGIASSENLYESMKAQNVPSTIPVEDLTADWHIIQVGTLTQFSRSYYNSTTSSIYFTHGNAMSFGGKEYLVAYHVQPSSRSEQRFAQEDALRTLENPADAPGASESKVVLYTGSLLAVSLIPMDTGYQIHEIRQLNPQKDIGAFPTGTKEIRLRSQSNLRQIALAMAMYTQDYDDTYPPMIAARRASDISDAIPDGVPTLPPSGINKGWNTVVQNRLSPYAESATVFLQPATHRPYLPNYKISRKLVSQVKDASKTFLFYEDAPDADGMRNVAYADGHVTAITEAEFQRERKAQGISESGYPSAAKTAQKAKPTPKP